MNPDGVKTASVSRLSGGESARFASIQNRGVSLNFVKVNGASGADSVDETKGTAAHG
jgi:hypothetical protein